MEVRDFVILLSKTLGTGKVPYLTIKERDLAPKVNWLSWPRLQALTNFSACVLQNCLYVIGGTEDNGAALSQVLRYNPMQMRWTEIASLSIPRSNHSAVALEDKIFVSGGLSTDNLITQTCESFEPLMNEWRQEPSMPAPIRDHASAAYDNIIIISGGSNQSVSYNNNIWIFETSRNTGEQTTDNKWLIISENNDPVALPSSLSSHVMLANKNKMYIIEGIREERDRNDSGNNLLRKHMIVFTLDFKLLITDVKGLANSNSKDLPEEKQPLKYTKRLSLNPKENNSVIKWHKNISNAPLQNPGAFFLGNKLYAIGNTLTEENCHSAVMLLDKQGKWIELFSLGDSNLNSPVCCILSIPISNKDFRSMSYSQCRWVLW